MKANEYIKKNGIANAKKILAMGSNALVNTGDNECFHTDDLKRLIESHELVEKAGGFKTASLLVVSANKLANALQHQKSTMDSAVPEMVIRLEKAIADVESCL